jgi:tetratricopeptide (TPR) repeat protein
MLGASVRLRRRSDRLWLLGAFLLLTLMLLNTCRNAISERLLPDPRLNRKLERAQLQLARGELSRGDGDGARELFESVLAVDPDQMQAQQGLLQVRNAALVRADVELRAHQLERARADLELAQALSAPQPQLQPLRQRLRGLEEASSDVPGLLARAAAPGLGDEQSLALLEQVLAIDAENPLALEGRHELFAQWLLQAEHDLDAGRVEAARARIERVLAEDPAHVDLPPLRARLGEAMARQQRGAGQDLLPPSAAVEAPEVLAVQARMAERSVDCFERGMAAGRLESAQTCLQSWLDADPGASAAAVARIRLAERWVAYAEERIGASDWPQARKALAAVRRWQPAHPQLPALEQRFERASGGKR